MYMYMYDKQIKRVDTTFARNRVLFTVHVAGAIHVHSLIVSGCKGVKLALIEGTYPLSMHFLLSSVSTASGSVDCRCLTARSYNAAGICVFMRDRVRARVSVYTCKGACKCMHAWYNEITMHRKSIGTGSQLTHGNDTSSTRHPGDTGTSIGRH